VGIGNVLDITGANESGPGWIHVTSAVAQHILRRAFTFVRNDGMYLLSTLDLGKSLYIPSTYVDREGAQGNLSDSADPNATEASK
jgi:hypothetical protein